MKIVKLHQNGRAFLVNVSNVSEVYQEIVDKSRLFFNFAVGDEQVSATVDESLDEILELIKKAQFDC